MAAYQNGVSHFYRRMVICQTSLYDITWGGLPAFHATSPSGSLPRVDPFQCLCAFVYLI